MTRNFLRLTLDSRLWRFVWFFYPIWYMAPVLIPNSDLRLGVGFSDTNLIIRQALILKSMKFPWSAENWSDSPNLISFWDTGNLINIGFNIPIWALTRVFDAAFAANIYALGGFLLTGLMANLLLRLAGCSRLVSSTFSLLVQVLPWLRQYGQFGITTTYFLALPLATLYLLIQSAVNKERKLYSFTAAFTLLLAVTNPYMLVFAIYMLTLVLLYSFSSGLLDFRKVGRSRLVLRTAVAGFGIASCYLLYRFLLRYTAGENGQPLTVYEHATIQSYGASLKQLVRPDHFHLLISPSSQLVLGDIPNYVGVSTVAFLVLGSSYSLIQRLTSPVVNEPQVDGLQIYT